MTGRNYKSVDTCARIQQRSERLLTIAEQHVKFVTLKWLPKFTLACFSDHLALIRSIFGLVSGNDWKFIVSSLKHQALKNPESTSDLFICLTFSTFALIRQSHFFAFSQFAFHNYHSLVVFIVFTIFYFYLLFIQRTARLTLFCYVQVSHTLQINSFHYNAVLLHLAHLRNFYLGKHDVICMITCIPKYQKRFISGEGVGGLGVGLQPRFNGVLQKNLTQSFQLFPCYMKRNFFFMNTQGSDSSTGSTALKIKKKRYLCQASFQNYNLHQS